MPEDIYSMFKVGNEIDGYTEQKFLTRSSHYAPGVGGKSTRSATGRLIIRPNPWDRYSYSANFRPAKTESKRNISRNGQWYLVTDVYYTYPQYWTNLARHTLSNKEPSADKKAKSKFFSEIIESKVSMAQTFAERQQAIDMVAQKVTRVFNAWRFIKKRKWQKARRALGLSSRNPRSKQASGQWLELQYGWKPLIMDAHDLLNFKPFAGAHVSAKASDSTNYIGYLGASVYSRELIEYGADVSITDPALNFANQCGLINPALIAWELMPFSFVIDWFLPVGDYLDNLTALSGLSVSGGYKSVKTVRFIDHFSKTGLQISAREDKFTRTLFSKSELGVPSLRFTNPISPMHLANAVALGRQLKKG